VDRREFLRAITCGAAALALGAEAWPAPVLSRKSGPRVVLARNRQLSGLEGEALDNAVAGLVHLAVKDAVGAGSAQQAWRRLFKPTDTVAVKVNCLAPELSPSKGIIKAIVQGLAAAGVPADRIIIYDKEDRDLSKAGYELRGKPPGPLCYGTIGDTVGPGYEERFTLVEQTSFRLSKIVTRPVSSAHTCDSAPSWDPVPRC